MSKKILFCGVGDIGDAAMKLAVIKNASEKLADYSISVVAGYWQIPIFKRCRYINQILECDYPWGNLYAGLNKKFSSKIKFLLTSGLVQRCRGEKFDVGITFSGSLFDQLLLSLSGIKQRIGYDQGRLPWLLTHAVRIDQGLRKTKIEEDLQLLNTLGVRGVYTLPEFSLTQEDSREADEFLKEQSAKERIILVCPGAGGALSKQWLPEYFAQVINQLGADHSVSVVVSGALTEKNILNAVKKYLCVPIVENCGRLSLSGFFALVKRSRVVICNNSSPMHIAAALRTPAVVINGGFNDYSESLVWGYKVKAISMLTADIGKRRREYDHVPCAQQECMRVITPDAVIKEVRVLLEGKQDWTIQAAVNSQLISSQQRCCGIK